MTCCVAILEQGPTKARWTDALFRAHCEEKPRRQAGWLCTTDNAFGMMALVLAVHLKHHCSPHGSISSSRLILAEVSIRLNHALTLLTAAGNRRAI